MHPLLTKAEAPYCKDSIAVINVGDTVRVAHKVKEGNKERIQVFEGIVIARRGEGLSQMVKVRKLSYGIGVERTFPLHSPNVEEVKVVKQGKPRRAKLFYLRQRVGNRALRVRARVTPAKVRPQSKLNDKKQADVSAQADDVSASSKVSANH